MRYIVLALFIFCCSAALLAISPIAVVLIDLAWWFFTDHQLSSVDWDFLKIFLGALWSVFWVNIALKFGDAAFGAYYRRIQKAPAPAATST